mgnify:CR=1 FL=1
MRHQYVTLNQAHSNFDLHTLVLWHPQTAGDEVVILDENALVSSLQCSYLDLGALEPSPSHSLMAYAIDASGYETYNIYIQSIPSGERQDSSSVSEDNKEVLTECGGEAVW